jgi:hypothetical protein
VADGFDQVGLILRIAERLQRHDAIHHGWVDGAEAVGVAGALQHPAFRLADGAGAHVLEAALFPELDGAIHLLEDDGGGVPLGQGELCGGTQQLIHAHAVRRDLGLGDGLHDGERHQDGARPGGHLIEDVAGSEHDLRRDAGRPLARVEAQQAEVDLGVAVGGLQAAQRQHAVAGAAHGGRIGIDAGDLPGQFAGRVGAGGRVDFRRAAGINVPTAIGELAAEDRLAGFADARRRGRTPFAIGVRLVAPQLVEDVIGFERGVGREIAPPAAGGLLQRFERLRGRGQRMIDARGALGCGLCGGRNVNGGGLRFRSTP